MFKKFVSAFLAFAVLIGASFGVALADPNTDDIVIKKGESSDNVILLQMRLRDLGYYNYKITGFFGDFTGAALKDFQKTNSISADGVAGKNTLDALYNNAAKRKAIEPLIKPPTKPKSSKKVHFGSYLDWFDKVRYMWKKGEVCTVTDLDTGISYKMKRVGGQYHADVAPINKTENKKFEKTYDSYPSWERRAVVVNIHGTLVAGSTNGYPHGSTGVPGNGMNLSNGHLQQVCIHFKNSRTHVHNMIDPAHQYEVKRAAGIKVGSRPALADN